MRVAHVVDVDHVPEDEMILDIGPKSVVERRGSLAPQVKTLVWNGPPGAFEAPPFDEGDDGDRENGRAPSLRKAN